MTPDEIKQYIEEEFPELVPNQLSDGWSFRLKTEKQTYNKIWSNRVLSVGKKIKLPVTSLIEKHKPENKNKDKRKTELRLNYSTVSELRSQILKKKMDVESNFASDNFTELLRFLVIHEAQQIVAAVPYEIKTKELVDAAKAFLGLGSGSEDASEVAKDIDETLHRNIDKTEKETLISARLGQGKFRKDVLARWEDQCAVTGIDLVALIRASHVKPWRDSSDKERLDPSNGLPLIANLDSLFDVGLISFDDHGRLLTSPELTDEQIVSLDLKNKRLSNKPDQKLQKFLKHHRESYGFDE